MNINQILEYGLIFQEYENMVWNHMGKIKNVPNHQPNDLTSIC